MQKKKNLPIPPKKNGKNSHSTGKKKVSNKREAVENPNLDKTYNLKSRTKLLDQDYLHKLNAEELAWLDKFNAETINADLDYKKLKNNLYATTKKKKKELTDANNARNRCILTKQEAMGRIRNLDEELKVSLNTVENVEILIDLKAGGFIDNEGRILEKKPSKNKKNA